MKKKIYCRPETDLVRLSAILLQEITYEGGSTSGDSINTTNEAVFSTDEETVPAHFSSNLWEE